MKPMRKITTIILVAVVISIFSLFSCFGVLGLSNSLKGTSVLKEDIWSVDIENISTLAVDDVNNTILKQPVGKDYNIRYALKLNRVNNYGQFQFDIKNEGNVSAKVKSIEVDGIEEYGDYVDVSVVNLSEGDVIKAGTLVNNIKVVTMYKEQLYDENMLPQYINLDNINIKVEFEKLG